MPAECQIVGAQIGADTVTIAVPDRIDPLFAPWAHTTGERILFGHLYETLASLDCLGNLQPVLSDVWSSEDDGRRWTFELMDGVRFWDGTPVTAQDVALSWQDAMSQGTPIDSVTVSSNDVLHVYFNRSYRQFPKILCGPAFSVAKNFPSPMILGSAPYRIYYPTSAMATHNVFLAEPAFGSGPVLRFIDNTGPDARDMLARDIDLMITRDDEVVGYAQGQDGFEVLALEWDRVYILLSTSRIRELRRGGSVGVIPMDFSERLARDAVRGDAQSYRSDSWWFDVVECRRKPGEGYPPVPKGAYYRPKKNILYDENDSVARDLAQRIIALATTDPSASADAATIVSAVPDLDDGSRLTAEGVSERTLAASLRAGVDFAYVVAIPIRPYDACDEARILLERAPWLVTLAADLSASIVPLVETRRHLIVANGHVSVAIDWYGNIRLGNRASTGW